MTNDQALRDLIKEEDDDDEDFISSG